MGLRMGLLYRPSSWARSTCLNGAKSHGQPTGLATVSTHDSLLGLKMNENWAGNGLVMGPDLGCYRPTKRVEMGLQKKVKIWPKFELS